MKTICLNRSVLEFMAERITRETFVLEYGAGWSSRWFADRCGRLLSVETNGKWVDAVISDLEGAACDWEVMRAANPGHVTATDADIVLVDCAEGYRLSATRAGWASLRAGGWLVFDDAQRPRHAEAVDYLNQFGEPVRMTWADGDIETARERLALAWQK